MKINLREVVIAILIFVVVFAAVHLSVESYRVDQSSMYPTFYGGNTSPTGDHSKLPNDCVMVDKLTYRFRGPHRGEVVILWPPTPSDYPFIKRVIGLPGETVQIQDGQVYIKTKNSSEFRLLGEDLPVVSETPRCKDNGTWEIPKGQYFVLGDNRDESKDSTAFGPVERSNIIGKTWLRYWPLSRFGLTPHYSYKLVDPTESTPTSMSVPPAVESPGLAVFTP